MTRSVRADRPMTGKLSGNDGRNPHPLLAPRADQTRHEPAGFVSKDLRTLEVRRAGKSGKLDRAADPDTIPDTGDDKTMVGKCDMGSQVETRLGKCRVVAAFCFKRDAIIERQCQLARPGTGSNDCMACRKRRFLAMYIDLVFIGLQTARVEYVTRIRARGAGPGAASVGKQHVAASRLKRERDTHTDDAGTDDNHIMSRAILHSTPLAANSQSAFPWHGRISQTYPAPIGVGGIEDQMRLGRHESLPGDRRHDAPIGTRLVAEAVGAADDALLNPFFPGGPLPI